MLDHTCYVTGARGCSALRKSLIPATSLGTTVSAVMYLPNIPRVLNAQSIVYLDKSRFTLDASGVAGFFGGAEAISAMATVHIFRNRKNWGWYNSPGSYEVAKRYGLLTKFGFFFGGGHGDPAELLSLFELGWSQGSPIPPSPLGVARRMTWNSDPYLPVGTLQPLPQFPIIVSAGTCAMCAAAADWYSFSLILLGIIANGISCLLIGSVKLKFVRPMLAGEESDQKSIICTPKSRRVSGILITPTNIVLLKVGKMPLWLLPMEDLSSHPILAADTPTDSSERAPFFSSSSSLLSSSSFRKDPSSARSCLSLHLASRGVTILLLCSLDKSRVQQQILFETILKLSADDVKRYPLDNWPAMVAFVLLTLIVEDEEVSERELDAVFKVLVEDTTEVWAIWKRVVLKQLLNSRNSGSPASVEDIHGVRDLQFSEEDTEKLSEGDRYKLYALLKEAQSGIHTYKTKFL
ncbi:hypothetical protein JVU11DRAFT_11464 [Chiua virens]|nr:hypothetical protein JVU11DRAFT_11464 [Chiua virens]